MFTSIYTSVTHPTCASRFLSFSLSCNFRFRATRTSSGLDKGKSLPKMRKQASLRLCNVSSYMTELLEMRAENPSIHVLFIPGNPGVITFYKDFVEALYELLGGEASVTAIGHISHTKKNWEHGRLFSLQDQIDHKIEFLRQELQNTECPFLMVGHSIGSYISLEIFKRFPDQVKYCIGLYPFLKMDKALVPSVVKNIAASKFLSVSVSSILAVLGLLPSFASKFLVRRSLGNFWSATAVEATCGYLLQYHVMRNVLFMALTEFEKLSEMPDWTFIRQRQEQFAFLFGIDDHWGPLTMFEEISKQVPGVGLSIEREGHTHSFCCTEAGSVWVAQHVVNLIKDQIQSQSFQG